VVTQTNFTKKSCGALIAKKITMDKLESYKNGPTFYRTIFYLLGKGPLLF